MREEEAGTGESSLPESDLPHVSVPGKFETMPGSAISSACAVIVCPAWMTLSGSKRMVSSLRAAVTMFVSIWIFAPYELYRRRSRIEKKADTRY
jgi:uncharacterized membrane protein YccC